MTKEEIFEEFGEDLSDTAINKITEYYSDSTNHDIGDNYVVVNTMDSLLEDGTKKKTPGLLAGLEVHPLYPYDKMNELSWSNTRRLIPVYECQ